RLSVSLSLCPYVSPPLRLPLALTRFIVDIEIGICPQFNNPLSNPLRSSINPLHYERRGRANLDALSRLRGVYDFRNAIFSARLANHAFTPPIDEGDQVRAHQARRSRIAPGFGDDRKRRDGAFHRIADCATRSARSGSGAIIFILSLIWRRLFDQSDYSGRGRAPERFARYVRRGSLGRAATPRNRHHRPARNPGAGGRRWKDHQAFPQQSRRQYDLPDE